MWMGETEDALMQLTVVLEEGEDGYIVASCPSLPGCYTQGKTEPEALANIREAIAAYLLPA
jgi:predicted RNase H-like HicB family nuclease